VSDSRETVAKGEPLIVMYACDKAEAGKPLYISVETELCPACGKPLAEHERVNLLEQD
jgi:hypothetical protein